MHPIREFFFHNASTSRTPLGGIPGIHFYKLSTSTFSLVRKHERESRPRCIMNISMLHFAISLLLQTFDIQILDTNDIITVDVKPGKFIQEVGSLVIYPFMNLIEPVSYLLTTVRSFL